MELRLLRYFLVVAEELHFTKAAARLGMAQPPLSQQIQKLERAVGEPLFYRGRRRAVELTEAGRALLPRAKQIVADADGLPTIARRAARGESGFLSVGFVGGATCHFLPAIVHEFHRRFPAVELELRDLDPFRTLEAIEARQMHIGLVRTARKVVDDRRDLRYTIVQKEPFAVAVPRSHRLARPAKRLLPLGELSAVPFLMYGRAGLFSLSEMVTDHCRSTGFTPRIVQHVNELQTILSLVAAGLGVALVPASVSYLRRPGIVLRQLAQPTPQTELLMVTHHRESSPTARLFQDIARRIDRSPEHTKH